MKSTTTNPTLGMKTINKNTLAVISSSATTMETNNSQYIFFTISYGLKSFESYPSIKLRFVQTNETNADIRVYKASSSYLIQGTSYETTTKTESGITYREIDLTNQLIEANGSRLYFAICAETSTGVTLYSDSNTDSTYLPTLIVEAIEEDEMLLYQKEITGSTNESDKYKVNLRNGELRYSKTLMTLYSEHLPIELAINYDERNLNNTIVNGAIETGMPVGWRLNYQQYIYEEGEEYKYVDGNNKKHTFKVAENQNSSSTEKVYYDATGTYLTLIINSEGNYEIRSSNEKQRLIFSQEGYLISIKEKVSDSKEYEVNLNYDSSNRLTSIEKDNGSRVTISYEEENSQIIILSRGNKCVTLRYDTNNQLTTIEGANKEITTFTYTTTASATTTSTIETKVAVKPVVPIVTKLLKTMLSITTNKKKIEFEYVDKIAKISSIKEIYMGETSEYEEVYYGISYSKQQTKLTITPNSEGTTNLGTIIKLYTFNEEGELIRENEIEGTTQISSKVYKRENNQTKEYQEDKDIIYLKDNSIISSVSTNGQEEVLELDYSEETSEDESEEVKKDSQIFVNYYISRNTSEDKNTTYETKFEVYLNNELSATINIDTEKDYEQQEVIPISTSAKKAVIKLINTNPYLNVIYKKFAVYQSNNSKQKVCSNYENGEVLLIEERQNYYEVPKFSLVYKYSNTNKIINNINVSHSDYIINKENYYQALKDGKTTYNVWCEKGKRMYANVTNVRYRYNSINTSIDTLEVILVNEDNYYCQYEHVKYNQSEDNSIEKHILSKIYSKIYENSELSLDTTIDFYGNTIKTKDDNGYIKEYEYIDGNIKVEKTSNDNSIYETLEPNDKELQTNYAYLDDRLYQVSRKYQNNEIGTMVYNNVDGEIENEYNLASPTTIAKKYIYNEDKISEIHFYPSTCSNQNTFEYLENNLTKIKRANTQNSSIQDCYEFIYDERNNLKEIKIFGLSYCTIETTHSSGLVIQTITYADGSIIKKTHDKFGRVVKIEKKQTSDNEFVLVSSATYSIVATTSNENKTFDSEYAKLREITGNNENYISYQYDYQGRLTHKIVFEEGYNDEMFTNSYTYSYYGLPVSGSTHVFNTVQRDYEDYNTTIKEVTSQGKIDDTNALSLHKQVYVKDKEAEYLFIDQAIQEKLHRGYKKSAQIGNLIYDTNYEFAQADTTASSNFIEKENYVIHTNVTESENLVNKSITYQYDLKGNIIGITKDGNKTNYQYDEHGQLTREDNQKLGKTFVMTYDEYGNLTSKKEYIYNQPNQEITTNLIKENTYTYDATNKTLLTSYNGNLITYNSKLEPTSYLGKTICYEEGKLTKYDNILFKYSLEGGRICKVKLNETSTTGYEYSKYYSQEGTDILKESNSQEAKDLIFINGTQGIIGFIYQGNTYQYHRNILGDVIGIYQGSNLVATYEYDAWGNHIVYNSDGSENTDLSSLGHINPIRYRGYFYDIETNLYYCNARYYNPEWGRWISPDSIEYLDPDCLNGVNLYCYCNNNPVMYYDPSGQIAISTLFALILCGIGFIAGATYAYDKAYNSGERGLELIFWTLLGGFAGGLVGLTIGYFTGSAVASLLGQGGSLAITGGAGATVSSVSLGGIITGTVVVSGAIVLTTVGALVGAQVLLSKILVDQGGVKITHNYPKDHGNPAHVHISSDGFSQTRIGPNGYPLSGDRPMTPTEKNVFWKNIKIIRKAIKKAQRFLRRLPW